MNQHDFSKDVVLFRKVGNAGRIFRLARHDLLGLVLCEEEHWAIGRNEHFRVFVMGRHESIEFVRVKFEERLSASVADWEVPLLVHAYDTYSGAKNLRRMYRSNHPDEQISGRTGEKLSQVSQCSDPALYVLATKYSLVDDDLLDFEDCPTWVFRVLEKLLSGDSFDREELERLRKCEHKYLAAAVHWIAWESTNDPWKAIQSCSLLRRSGNSKKALRLLKSLDPVGWNSRAVSAWLTTQGGAQADLELFDESWKSGHAAISAYDTSPHPYMLLGALCYRTDRCAEGDTYFSEAKARGATDREIEYSRLEAERLTSRNTPKK